jgi:phosphatidylserine decarboxylase
VIGAFARLVGVDRAEAEAPPAAYPSVAAYFVRRLREGIREWPEDPDVVASPVDGVVGAVGTIRNGTVLQAKGMPYRVEELLASPDGAGEGGRFEGGRYVTLYLSPRHYHRIHSPATGSLREVRAIPGRLLPVNEPAIRSVPGIFPRNERLVLHMETEAGPLALVAVGAFNVGRISVSFDPGWEDTNRRRSAGPRSRRYDPPLPLVRGEEVAAFQLGSTVVLLLPPRPDGDRVELNPRLVPGAEVRLGDPLHLRSIGPGPAGAHGSG